MMALLAQQVVWGYVALEKGIPRSSKSFLGAATRSPVYGIGLVLVRVFCGPGAGGGDLFSLLQARWLPSA